jgi:hypothetical protein
MGCIVIVSQGKPPLKNQKNFAEYSQRILASRTYKGGAYFYDVKSAGFFGPEKWHFSVDCRKNIFWFFVGETIPKCG